MQGEEDSDFIIDCDYCGQKINLKDFDSLDDVYQICCECAAIYCESCVRDHMDTVPRVLWRHALNDERTGYRLIDMYPEHYYCEKCFVELEETIERKK
jgi:hypothetical protein